MNGPQIFPRNLRIFFSTRVQSNPFGTHITRIYSLLQYVDLNAQLGNIFIQFRVANYKIKKDDVKTCDVKISNICF